MPYIYSWNCNQFCYFNIFVSVSEEEKQRFSANLKNFDQFLGPYPYDSWKKWISHSNRLTGI